MDVHLTHLNVLPQGGNHEWETHVHASRPDVKATHLNPLRRRILVVTPTHHLTQHLHDLQFLRGILGGIDVSTTEAKALIEIDGLPLDGALVHTDHVHLWHQGAISCFLRVLLFLDFHVGHLHRGILAQRDLKRCLQVDHQTIDHLRERNRRLGESMFVRRIRKNDHGRRGSVGICGVRTTEAKQQSNNQYPSPKKFQVRFFHAIILSLFFSVWNL